MKTFAVEPINPFVPVFQVRAHTAAEALRMALALHPVRGIWQV